MKPDRLISFIALLVSVASLGYAVWLHQNINSIAQAALRQRETELVHHFTPNVLELYRGLGVADKLPKSPQTIEQLLQPGFDMISNMDNDAEEPAQSSDSVTNSQTSPNQDDLLQAAFLQFPLLEIKTNDAGEPEFQTIRLNSPVKLDGTDYYGFRFQVPPRENRDDFVWAFVNPAHGGNWYIVPQTGEMTGFTHYLNRPKKYLGTEHLYPLSSKSMILQSLSGDNLQDGKIYLVFFSFDSGKPPRLSLVFTFAKLGAKRKNEAKAIEKALALKLPSPLSSATNSSAANGSKVNVSEEPAQSSDTVTNVK